MRNESLCVLIAVGLAACSAAPTANLDNSAPSLTAVPAMGVAVSAAVAGRSANGDTVRITIRNSAPTARYLVPCGAGPLILVGQVLNGVWTDPVKNFACPAPVLPSTSVIRLATGDSAVIVRLLSIPGSYRFVAFAGGRADLADAARTTSNAVTER